jgi:phenylpropionate dioxygenase-like ring-hydroxylating dioxygenase large terminal subunit
MGADLSNGCVKNGRLACPLHGWEYAPDGHSVHLPASPTIPAFARQTAYPASVIGGHLFFFNRPVARFPLPFFAGCNPAEMHPARVCKIPVDTPWQNIGANGFDLQHFRCAHDRTLVGEPVVETPHELARRIRANLEVTGDSLLDRITRRFAGRELTMTVEVWAGGYLLVTAKFRRTTTYGMLSLLPLANETTLGRLIMWVPHSKGLARLLDPINAEVRRFFIRAFLQSDIGPLTGVRVNPGRLIDADKVLAAYFEWLHNAHR